MTENEIEKIVTFIEQNSPYKDKDTIRRYVRLHISYRTAVILWEGNEVVGVCRWNIEEQGRVAHVLDLIFDKRHRGKKLITLMLTKALTMWSQLKIIKWERGMKDNKQRIYTVEQMLRRI